MTSFFRESEQIPARDVVVRAFATYNR